MSAAANTWSHTREGDLLLFVQAAQRVSHAFRQQPRLVERLPDRANCAAEVTARDRRCNENNLRQIVSRQLRLTGDKHHLRYLAERENTPVRCGDRNAR